MSAEPNDLPRESEDLSTTDGPVPGKTTHKMLRPPWIIGLTIAFVIVAGLSLVKVPEFLLMNWVPNGSVKEHSQLLGLAAQIVLFALGGIIAIVGVALSLSRHGEELDAAERERWRLNHEREKDALQRQSDLASEAQRIRELEHQRAVDARREMRSRLLTAVSLLSSKSAHERKAALYALGSLADDWAAVDRRAEVQECINVICGYLRAPLPYSEEDVSTPIDEVDVRSTGYEVLTDHLRRTDGNGSWGTYRINLTRAIIDFPVDFSDIVINGTGMLRMISISYGVGGRFNISRLTVANGGTVRWSASEGDPGVAFIGRGLVIDHGQMRIEAAAQTRTIDLAESSITRGSLQIAAFGNANINLSSLTVEDTSVLRLWAGLSTKVDFLGANVTDNSQIQFGLPKNPTTIHSAGITVASYANMNEVGEVRLPDGKRLSLQGDQESTATDHI